MDSQSSRMICGANDPAGGHAGEYTQAKIKRSDFPSDFVFGSGASAYQLMFANKMLNIIMLMHLGWIHLNVIKTYRGGPRRLVLWGQNFKYILLKNQIILMKIS